MAPEASVFNAPGLGPLGVSPFIVVLCVVVLGRAAFGASSGAGTLTDVANAYKVTSAGWISTALGYAHHLFFALVAIELAWTAITYLVQRDSLSDFVSQLVLKLMGVFFFLALLQNAPKWIPDIIDSFSHAGATIAGGVVLDPSTTFGQGLQLAKSMLGTINNPNFFTAMLAVLISVLCAIGVVVAFAVVAGQLMVTLIESYIVVSAGIFFLGFSGSRWTLPFSEKYVAYAISVGIKLFMLYLIVGLGQTLASQWSALFTPGVIAAPDIYIGVAGSALIFMLLGWQIPSLAASLMNGSPLMTLGTAASTLSTTVAAGAAAVGGGLAAAGAVGAAGIAGAASLVAGAANPKKLEGPASALYDGVGVITAAPRGASQAANATRSASSSKTPDSGVGSGSERLGNSGETASLATGDSSTTSADPAEVAGSQSDHDTPQAQSGVDSDTRAPLAQQTEPPRSSSKPPAAQEQPSSTPSQSRTRPSILDILRNIRPPTFPNDVGSGSIHIRFKHHDAE